MPPVTRTLARFAIGFVLVGGVGIPVFFVAVWAVVRVVLAGNADALYHAAVWIEAFRVMLWPSSLLIIVRAAGDTAGEISDLTIAVLANVGLYALLGVASALACRSRISEIILVIVVVLFVYTVNTFWSDHLASFLITGAIITMLFVALFRKYGVRSGRVTNST